MTHILISSNEGWKSISFSEYAKQMELALFRFDISTRTNDGKIKSAYEILDELSSLCQEED